MIREGDVIYTDTRGFVVEDTDDYPDIIARPFDGGRTRTFSADELWSPETGVWHPHETAEQGGEG